MTDRVSNERRRSSRLLRRRASARSSAEPEISELGGNDRDRRVATLVRQALAVTGARRVTLFRPISTGQRWHSVTVLSDGGFYLGWVAPDGLVLPMVAYVQRRPVLLGPNRPHSVPAPRVEALGFRSYLGLPLVLHERVVAVLEAVDVAEPERLAGYETDLQAAMAALAAALSPGAEPSRTEAPAARLTEATVLDLVRRPTVNENDPFKVLADERALLAHVDGDRPLAAVAVAASMTFPEACGIAADLLDRGLLCIRREDRS